MLTTIFLLLSSIRRGFRTRATLQAEILALRHQLLVFKDPVVVIRLRLGRADRLLWFGSRVSEAVGRIAAQPHICHSLTQRSS